MLLDSPIKLVLTSPISAIEEMRIRQIFDEATERSMQLGEAKKLAEMSWNKEEIARIRKEMERLWNYSDEVLDALKTQNVVKLRLGNLLDPKYIRQQM